VGVGRDRHAFIDQALQLGNLGASLLARMGNPWVSYLMQPTFNHVKCLDVVGLDFFRRADIGCRGVAVFFAEKHFDGVALTKLSENYAVGHFDAIFGLEQDVVCEPRRFDLGNFKARSPHAVVPSEIIFRKRLLGQILVLFRATVQSAQKFLTVTNFCIQIKE
jgi:hypothetical protein